jgi:predicted glycogen debranching enzyme
MSAPTSIRPTDGREALRVERESLLKLESALSREWLETDGLGGFAASTILLCPTRRYHGLLVGAPAGHAKRHVFLAGLDESIHGADRAFALSLMRYPGVWHPHGQSAMESFELRPFPCFTYHIGHAWIRREILVVRGRQAVLVRWSAQGVPGALELRVRPLFACREADALTFVNLALDPRVLRFQDGFAFRPYGALPPTSLRWSGVGIEIRPDPVWYRNIEYTADIARGYDGHEDQFSPAVVSARLEEGSELVLGASLGEPLDAPGELWRQESARRRAHFAHADVGLRGILETSADDFLYRMRAPSGRERSGVVAGFPWFGEWGRDTFITLPGLLLARGQVEECGAALEGALEYLRGGLLPNVFGPSVATSDYGSADAALWFARAVGLYERAGGSEERLVARLFPALLEIGDRYVAGTELGIRCDHEGLLHCGNERLSATWMDARVDGQPVTPRHGFPVEVNALWYQLMADLERLLTQSGRVHEAGEWKRRRVMARRAFLERFWLENEGYLADVWRPDGADTSLRPNMVIAAALEHTPISRDRRIRLLRRAAEELLTARGLRTLSPKSSGYEGRYAGGPRERDRAYHQGTVWPWLLGFWCEAVLRAFGPRSRFLAEAGAILRGFDDHLRTQALGHVSEVFDGDSPHRPGGAVAQAWSLAELLRGLRIVEEGRA